uniref:Hypothetical conserved protein n=1 Tax=uncultured Chloroflexota bacterium TaxID=166587 RepID=H5SPD0_9CHLR|nr:hypothetical conserved protein [uncultured Chloroflexota bacterium]
MILLTITSLPYLYGAWLSSPERSFSGFVIGLEDGNSYLAKMNLGRSGYWLFRLVYTPEPHQGALFFLYYLLLGKVAGLTGLSNVLVLHLSRLFTIPFGLLAFYYFAAYFTPPVFPVSDNQPVRQRQLASLIFGFTGGLGWLWLIMGGSAQLGQMPVDLWVPDASFFLSALTYPHLPLAQGLLLILVVSGLEFVENGRLRPGLAAAACGLAVSLIHPHTLPVIGLIFGLYILRENYPQPSSLIRKMARLLLITAPSTPYLVYVLVVFTRNPAFVAWRVQSLTFSPAPVHYLLGFGLTLALAIPGLKLTWTLTTPQNRFLQVWLLSVPFLVYLPLALQRRFLDGYQAPLAILAATGLLWLLEKFARPGWNKAGLGLSLVVMSLTNLLLVVGALVTVARQPYPVFIPTDQVKAGRWLAQQSPQAVVLAWYTTGNYLPTVADVRSFVGHGPETINSAAKQQQVNTFFNPTTNDAWRLELLRRFKVRYLFYGPAEQALGEFNPESVPYLVKRYENDSVQIFEVDLK